MCLGIPGQVVDTFLDRDLRMGHVRFGGIARSVCLEYVPDVREGDWVLVHVGFALAHIDETEARRIFELLTEMGELMELMDPSE